MSHLMDDNKCWYLVVAHRAEHPVFDRPHPVIPAIMPPRAASEITGEHNEICSLNPPATLIPSEKAFILEFCATTFFDSLPLLSLYHWSNCCFY